MKKLLAALILGLCVCMAHGQNPTLVYSTNGLRQVGGPAGKVTVEVDPLWPGWAALVDTNVVSSATFVGATNLLTGQINGKAGTNITISTTAPLAGGGDLSANRTLSMPQASVSVNGWLLSNDWSAFNAKAETSITNGYWSFIEGTNFVQSQVAGYVQTNRTINTSAPLSGGGMLVGDLTLSIPAASATANGYLISNDWSAFNAKAETSITNGYTPLTASTLWDFPNRNLYGTWTVASNLNVLGTLTVDTLVSQTITNTFLVQSNYVGMAYYASNFFDGSGLANVTNMGRVYGPFYGDGSNITGITLGQISGLGSMALQGSNAVGIIGGYIVIPSNINTSTKLMYDDNGVRTFDWKNRYVYDTANKSSANFYSRFFYGTDGSTHSLEWGNRVLVAGDSRNSVDWSARTLLNSMPVTVLDWNLRYIYGDWTVSSNLTVLGTNNAGVLQQGGVALGQMAFQNSNAVAISGGSVSPNVFSGGANATLATVLHGDGTWAMASAAGQTFYLNGAVASDIGGIYKAAGTTLNSTTTVNTNTVNAVTNGQYLVAFATPSAGMGTTVLPAGVYHVEYNAYFNSGGGRAVTVKPEIYIRNAGGTEYLEFPNATQTILTGSQQAIEGTVYFPTNTIIATTDRLVAKFKVVSQSNNPNVSILTEGVTIAHFETAVPVTGGSMAVGSVVGNLYFGQDYISNIVTGAMLEIK